jgi:hypothetical protein
LESSSQGLSELKYDMLMSRLSVVLSRKTADPSLNNAILATILSGSLNFFHSKWKDFDKN